VDTISGSGRPIVGGAVAVAVIEELNDAVGGAVLMGIIQMDELL
jgi:hypothetical protein